jgi:hypothetical protein
MEFGILYNNRLGAFKGEILVGVGVATIFQAFHGRGKED